MSVEVLLVPGKRGGTPSELQDTSFSEDEQVSPKTTKFLRQPDRYDSKTRLETRLGWKFKRY